MEVRATITGEGNAAKALEKLLARALPKISLAQEVIGRRLHEESLAVVPRDTEALATSSHVYSDGSGLAKVTIVAYGRKGDVFVGFSEKEGKIVERRPFDYAVFVHEIGPTHPSHNAGQSFDFLRGVAVSKIDELRRALRSVI